MTNESETIQSNPTHLSYATLYTAKNEICSSGIFFSTLSHILLLRPIFLTFLGLGVVLVFEGFLVLLWVREGVFRFFPSPKIALLGQSKTFFLASLQDNEILEIWGRQTKVPKKSHLTLSKFSFSSWEPYTSCRRTEGTTLTFPWTPATPSQERC